MMEFNNNLINQQSNIEEARYYDMCKREEQNVVSKFFKDSTEPISTNQIPYGMNQNLRNNPHQTTNNFIEQMEKSNTGVGNSNCKVYSELTGGYMNKNDFEHNNMVIFQKSTQNTETFKIKIY